MVSQATIFVTINISKERVSRKREKWQRYLLLLKQNMGQILLPLISVAQLPQLELRGRLGPGDDEASDYTAHYSEEILNQMQLLLYNSKTELSVFFNYFWFLFPSPLSAHWFLAYKEKLQRTLANPTLLFEFYFFTPFYIHREKKKKEKFLLLDCDAKNRAS